MSYLDLWDLFTLLVSNAATGDPRSIALLAVGIVAMVLIYKGWKIDQERRAEKLRLGIGRGGLERTPLPTTPLYTPLEPLTTTHDHPSTNLGPTP